MYYKLLLGLTLSAIFTVTVSAQSGSRGGGGSSSRGSNAAANAARAEAAAAANAAAYERKVAYEADREYLKVAKQIAKKDFAPIHLTKPQLLTLKQAVAANYQTLVEIDNSMLQYIPTKQRKKLKKIYKKSLKDGLNEMEAMDASMQAVGISETSQEKVTELSKTKMEILETVKSSVTSTLSKEQTDALAASASEKKGGKKTTTKQGSTKKQEGSSTKQEGSTTKQGSTSK